MSESTQQRRDEMLARVRENGHVAVRELAAEMDASESTVRRDLRSLADAGKLELVYGGAILPRNTDYSFHSKSARNVEAKRTVGRLAAELVADDDQILIDSGTTSYEMVPFLKGRRGLSVIVNSARHAMELDAPGTSAILLGGQYRHDRMDTVGPLATATLEQLRGFRAFLGVDGLSMDFGLTASDIDSAHLYRLAVRNARESILVADHSKFLSPSLFRIVGFDAITRVVTDRRPSEDWMSFLQSLGINVLYPEASEPAEDEATYEETASEPRRS